MSGYPIDRIASVSNVFVHSETTVTSVTSDQWGWLRNCSAEIDERGFGKAGYLNDARAASAKRVAAATGDGLVW
jgi:thioredoxin reductase (NADPH)